MASELERAAARYRDAEQDLNRLESQLQGCQRDQDRIKEALEAARNVLVLARKGLNEWAKED